MTQSSAPPGPLLESRWARLRVPSTRLAWALLALAVGASWLPNLGANAVGVEALATAFWLWARRQESASIQVQRWRWLRRPASAMWLAFGLTTVGALVPTLIPPGRGAGLPEAVHWAAAAAALWAALDLMAALPVARPYPDWQGPHAGQGPWLTLAAPLIGLGVLWRTSDLWGPLPELRTVAAATLLFCALIAAIRAFGRVQWLSSLRWLAVADTALGGVLLSLGVVPQPAALLLAGAAIGARAVLIVSELHGAASRRGSAFTALWRVVTWSAGGGLAWAVALSLGEAPRGLAALGLAPLGLVAAIAAGVAVSRLVPAPERRSLSRLGGGSFRLAVLGVVLLWCVAAGIASVLRATFPVLDRSQLAVLIAVAAGGLLGGLGLHLTGPLVRHVEGAEKRTRLLARSTFQSLVRSERALIRLVSETGGRLLLPLRDLHTGDAQEYLLLLLALAVAALLLPFLG